MKKEKGWYINFSNNFRTPADFTSFYLLPSISFFKDKIQNEYTLDIIFEWLFWSFSITRYWNTEEKGNEYDKRE